MTDKLVPTVQTKPTMLEFAAALLEVWPDATKESASVLYAHFAGETGRGAYCWNHNYGNVKYSKGCGLDYMALLGVWEGFVAKDETERAAVIAHMTATGFWTVDPSKDHAAAVGPSKVSLIATKINPTTWFRAYPDRATGMKSFVAMKQAGRYASAWAFVVAGDCDGYARELGRKGYYTASPDKYSEAMQVHQKEWMAADAFEDAVAAREPAPIPEPSEPDPATVHPQLNWDEPAPREV